MRRQNEATRSDMASAIVVGFSAATAGLGRTAAITNVAWIMASAGIRVLVVDWSRDSVGAHDFLRPFPSNRVAVADAMGDRKELLDAAPVWLTNHAVVERYTVPREGRDDASIDLLTSAGATDTLPSPDDSSPGWIGLWRRILIRMPYDYVLVDGPTGLSDARLNRDAQLLDIGVFCFPPQHRKVRQVAQTSVELYRAAPVRIRIIGLLTQLNDSNPTRAEQSRAMVRAEFGELLSLDGANELLEIPYYPPDEYDETLAVLLDEPGDPNNPLASYEQLARSLTSDDRLALVPAPELIRGRYRNQYGLEPSAPVPVIGVAYLPQDRLWADWVRQQLEAGGAHVALLRSGVPDELPVGGVVVIESDGFRHSVAAQRWAERAVRWRIVGLVVHTEGPDVWPPPSAWPVNKVVVGDDMASLVATRLLGEFDLVGRQSVSGTQAIRFPRGITQQEHISLPPRNASFTGRDDELEAVRDALLAGVTGRVVLGGPPGVGKSEIAREYAHRFRNDYDVIWWVPAHDLFAARASLLVLADECMFADSGDSVRELLDSLSSGQLKRWLLVFDNVDDPTAVAGLRPEADGGHLLITSRQSTPSDDATGVAVESFTPMESNTFCQGTVRALSDADAERVSQAVAHLPLAIGLATAWLREAMATTTALGATVSQAAEWSVDELLTRMDRSAAEPPASSDADRAPQVVVSVVRAILDSLRRTDLGRLAITVAQFCAFLSPEGVSLRLLRSASVLRAVADVDTKGLLNLDAAQIDTVLWAGVRHGLFDVDWGQEPTLVIHRLVQTTLRGILSETERDARHRQVLGILAEYAPREVDSGPESNIRFAELQRHLLASGALDDMADDVRLWLVNHTRYVYREGDGPVWQYAAGIVADMAERWRAEFGADDPLLQRLYGQLANIHRAQGHYREALRRDEEVLVNQRRCLDVDHRQTLITMRGRGGDLRGVGRFDEAYDEDHVVWNKFREILGDDHPDTRKAANNLATSAFLIGDTRQALELEQDNLDRRMRLFGYSQETCFAMARLGVYHRELGDYGRAMRLLEDAHSRMRALKVQDNRPDMLLILWNLAIAERRIGKQPAAKNRMAQTRDAYRALFGERHLYTLGSALSLAANYYDLDDAPLAVELAQRCLDGYAEFDDQHPFTAICRMNLALYQRAVGRLDEALAASEAASTELRRLGDQHPWALIATVNHAGLLAGRGDLSGALEIAEPCHLACREFLGEGHPYTVVSWDNLSMMRAAPRSTTTSDDVARWKGMDADVPQT